MRGYPHGMKIVILGAGGVGTSMAAIAARRQFFEEIVLADINTSVAEQALGRIGDPRFSVRQQDASKIDEVVQLLESVGASIVVNACDPRFNPAIFEAASRAGVTYVDMALSLSTPHPEHPYELPGLTLGELQFDQHEAWNDRGQLALVGMGADPGLSNVFARYARDNLFRQIDEIGIRDGGNMKVDGYVFAPTFSIWTTIEECLNPPLIWKKGRGLYTTEPFSEPEIFRFPDGIGPVECVNVEHEEVVMIPKWVDCSRVSFKYGLGREFIEVLRTLHLVGFDSTRTVRVGDSEVSPRDVAAATLPNPALLGDRMHGKSCVGAYITGTAMDGSWREMYLYHVADNEVTMREYGCQAVAWQTAVNAVVALELLAEGAWKGAGVLGPEAFFANPFLELLGDYGTPHGIEDRTPGRVAGLGDLTR